MKTLVAYASKHGCAEDCAKELAGKLDHSYGMLNLKTGEARDLSQYDCVVIGGSICVGRIQKEVRRFCEQNLQALLGKKVMLFMCCMSPKDAEGFFKSNFPAALLAHAMQQVNLGGELRQERMGFFSKKITAMAAKAMDADQKQSGILHGQIDALAAAINAEA